MKYSFDLQPPVTDSVAFLWRGDVNTPYTGGHWPLAAGRLMPATYGLLAAGCVGCLAVLTTQIDLIMLAILAILAMAMLAVLSVLAMSAELAGTASFG